jgi:hypothetical protein
VSNYQVVRRQQNSRARRLIAMKPRTGCRRATSFACHEG